MAFSLVNGTSQAADSVVSMRVNKCRYVADCNHLLIRLNAIAHIFVQP